MILLNVALVGGLWYLGGLCCLLCRVFFSQSQLGERITKTCLRVHVKENDTEHQKWSFQKMSPKISDGKIQLPN